MAEAKPGRGKFKVIGHVAVVKILDGSERYLYRGAVFNAAQVDESRVKHLLSVGLITKVADAEPSAAEKAAAAKAEAEKKEAADKAAAERAAAEKAAAATK
ncbi:hypothetical protein ACI3KS_05140 [Microbacterium sp. ZW T5_45]|uniref:hypothetical protein n=1 Tax=Microbacterium sp. ZW T5_45 TaxID=3378080 RepID=UPI003852A6D0